MIKSNKEVTLKTRETYFLYRKPQKPKIAEIVFRKLFLKKNENFLLLGKLHSAEKKRKLASNRRSNKIGVSFKNGQR